MDIITHALSGMAVGVTAANFMSGSLLKKSMIIGAGTIAGALPDIDVVTMWGGFDTTLGKMFNLSVTGREAFGAKFWYSHHAFFHSLLAAVLFGVLLGVLMLIFRVRKDKQVALLIHIKKVLPFVVVFVLGYTMHIIEDMVTPGGGWGGVALWWPSAHYSGGYGDIWWWNNYDVFLIVCGVVIINSIFFLFESFIAKVRGKLSLMIFIMGFALGLSQIKSRGYDFRYKHTQKSYPECEAKSKEIQKEILGEKVYGLMEFVDGVMPVAF